MNRKQFESFQHVHQQCPACGRDDLTRTLRQEEFMYGRDDEAVRLSVTVPTYECSACGLSFTGSEAEDLRHDAICRHLGLLTPSEVKAIREELRLSRAEFAKLTRIGEASIARWESGALMQGAGYDQYLRLLRKPGVLDALKDLSPDKAEGPYQFRLLGTPSPIQRLEARRFELRKCA
jgi:putative zinc finger/helix-turn-helix YgiT family protein